MGHVVSAVMIWYRVLSFTQRVLSVKKLTDFVSINHLLQLGIGSLFERHGLATPAPTCVYDTQSSATREWQAISGCSSSIPLEQDYGPGNQCGHWDEMCFGGELMTGIANGDYQLSRMTVGGLDDLGYCVNYDEADTYDASNLDPVCTCTARVRQLEGTGNDTDGGPKRRRKLSVTGRETALAYGLDEIEKTAQDSNGSSDLTATGVLMVLFEEGGEIYSVTVTKSLAPLPAQ
jgi:hypothetical protein